MPDQLIGLVHPKFADCYWEEYKMFHISIFCSWFFISSHIHSRFPICRSSLCLQLIWSFTKTTTPPPILPTLSRWNGGNLYPGILSISSLTWGRNQLSVNESISWQEYSAAIRSNFGVILWIFSWRKETELCIKLLTVVEVELILPKLLDKSESEGPGFISIPDIISKIHITMHKKA